MARLQVGRYKLKERIHKPTIEDMRCVYIGERDTRLMSTWRNKPDHVRARHLEQADLLREWLDRLMVDGKLNEGWAMVINQRASDLLNSVADALIEYDILDQAERAKEKKRR